MPIEITMPRLSDTMEMGTVLHWHVQEGDEVSSGDVIADIETDKATMELQSFDDGTVEQILVSKGTRVNVGTVIARLIEEDEAPVEIGDSVENIETGSTENKTEPVLELVEETKTESTLEKSSKEHNACRVSPVARRLAEDHGIDLSTIQGSGPLGRIIKRDILQAIDATQETTAAVAVSTQPTNVIGATPIQPLASTPWRQDRTEPLSNMRQVIAQRLVESKQTIPHYQVSMTFDMDPLIDMRKALNEQLSGTGIKLSVNDFIVRCCALSMSQHPEFNSSFGGDCILYHGPVNIGIAIALPEERGGGLVVASLRHADQKSLRTISQETAYLSNKARESGLTVDEMADATFTISNLGMFGVDNFTAIINPPNSAILAVGAAIQRPVVREGELVVGHEMSATLSLDHRVIDGAMAANYLKTLKEFIEKPASLLV